METHPRGGEGTLGACLPPGRHVVRTTLKEWWAERPTLSAIHRLPGSDVLLAVALSLVPFLFASLVFPAPLDPDASVQLEMARSLAVRGSLMVNGAPSMFYPPLYPLILLLPGLAVGFNPGMVHSVNLLLWAVTVFSTYYVGASVRRLAGLLGAPLVAINPIFLAEAAAGRATILSALLLLWLFHLVRIGVTRDARIGWAGILAGLLYLTKDTAGYISVLGILIGFAWRARTLGLMGVLRSRHYWLGGGFFLAAAGGWALRNELVLGTPLTNPSLVAYTRRFLFGTSPGLAATLLFGAGALLLLHWIVWPVPALIDPRVWQRARRTARQTLRSPTVQALLIFLGTTVLLSTVVAALFMRNEATEPFPASVPNYYRYLATADPLLMIGVALAIRVPTRGDVRPTREAGIALAKTLAVATILMLAIPPTAAQLADQAAVYPRLGAFLESHNVTTAYSEGNLILAADLPGFRWIPVHLDFAGPTLNYSAAGVPDGATIVTVGSSSAANFSAGPYSVILHFDAGAPPIVLNPFYVP